MTVLPHIPHRHHDPDDEGNSWESSYESNGVELPYGDQDEAVLPVPEPDIVQLRLTRETRRPEVLCEL